MSGCKIIGFVGLFFGAVLRLPITSVLQVIKQLSKKAKITKRVYTHLIRHCTFTHQVEAGIDINLIQKIAGHKNVKTTLLYTHISDNLISKIKSPIENIKL